jgi:phosphatidylcholine synthase
VLVFVPIRYIYPSRTPIWQWPTNLLGVVWGALLLVMLWQYPNVSPAITRTSLAYPAYYLVLSLVVHFSWGPSRTAGH